LVAKGYGLGNSWLLWLSKIFMTKKGDVVLICKGVDNIYLWVYHFECISNLSKKQKQQQQ
jgi:hypothetical protein